MGVDFSIAVFYGIIINEEFEEDELKQYGLHPLYFFESKGFGISADGYYKIRSDDEYNEDDEIIPIANLKDVDEKIIKFLQIKGIKSFKGPALFVKGYFS
jgi:hypothetical protein